MKKALLSVSARRSGALVKALAAEVALCLVLALCPVSALAAGSQTVRMSGSLSADGSVLTVTCELSNPAGAVDSGMLALAYDTSRLSLSSAPVRTSGLAHAAATDYDASKGFVSVEWYYAARLAASSAYSSFAVFTFNVRQGQQVATLGSVLGLCADSAYLKKLGGYQYDGGLLLCGGSSEWTAAAGTAAAVMQLDASRVVRLGGANRYETGVLISKQGWTSSRYAVLASGTGFADALAGAPLAAALGAPILLVSGSALTSDVSGELSRLGVTGVVILGGTSAVSASIENTLKKSYSVERIAGSDRFGTSVKIAERLATATGKKPREVYFAYAYNYPDALAISSIAGIAGQPILYAPKTGSLDKATAAYVKSSGCTTATVLGGTSAIGDSVVTSIRKCGVSSIYRLYGDDRYATALKIYKWYNSLFTSDDIAVATGKSFPDALAGGALAAKLGIPVVLVGDLPLTAGLTDYIGGKEYGAAYVFGGANAVPESVISALGI